MTATTVREHDPYNQGRILWMLNVNGVSDCEVRLIEGPDERLWSLTVGTAAKDTSVVPLFDRKLFESMGTERVSAYSD